VTDHLRAVVRGVLPGVLAALIALAGQLTSTFASVALLLSPALHAWLLIALGLVLLRLYQKRARGPAAPSVEPVLAGLVAALLAEVALAGLVTSVPSWVKARAAVALFALDDYRQSQGSYPRLTPLQDEFPLRLRSALAGAHCQGYEPDGDSYKLTCEGVLFTKCTYDHATHAWRSWD
jgi:hypothetical protein